MTADPRARDVPPTLAEAQAFLGRMLQRSAPLAGATSEAERARIAALVTGNARLSPLEQVEIYREQFFLRHRDSLVEDFPALAYLLGRDAFHALVRAYLAAHPPASYTLRDLPLALPAFAAQYDGFSADLAAIARALARFEVAFITTFDSPEVAPVSPAKVAAIREDAWPNARLRLHPGLALFALDHPLHLFRSAVRRDEEPPRSLASGRVDVALWRGDDRRVHQTELEPAEHALLGALAEELTLEEACLRATSQTEGAEPNVAAWFAGWARRGWVVDVLVADGSDADGSS
ncbi:MAG: putative DNA-binding domain-containing protein [Deltaproteobacteria bacterium]|nr:putative DNA-binding domain-containing protein [Deltaproteobacteria bacterium]